jgi:two-component system, cell cycle response regulator CtrA
MMNEVARLGHARIVLIEDDPESRASLQMLLEEEGAAVVAVADAEDGAEAAITHLPDAVICDLDLPGMDGFYLIQRLRDHEIRGNLPPSVAIALTGHDGDEYRLRSIGEGFQHFMTKPAHPDELVALIQVAITRPRRARDDGNAEHDDADNGDRMLRHMHGDQSPAHAANENQPAHQINNQGHRLLLFVVFSLCF